MATRALALLGRPIRWRALLHYTGLLTGPLAIMGGVAAVAALLYGAPNAAIRYAAIAAAAGAIGYALAKVKFESKDLRLNESLAVTALAFVVAAAMFTWPFAASGAPWVDALFESVSAVTTTGLSTLGPPATLPGHLLFARSWGQWYGGLMIMVLALGLLLGPGRAAKRLAAQQMSSDEVLSGSRKRARDMLGVYGALTLAGFAALWIQGVSPSDALIVVMSSVSTGGFSSRDGGLMALGGWPVPATLLVIFMLGAISFPLQSQIWKRGPGVLWRDTEVRTLLLLWGIVTAALIATLSAAAKLGWREIIWQAPFLAASAQSTTGYATLDVAGLDAASKLVLIASMAIGGDIGSTAGGFKIFRFLIMTRLVGKLFARTALPPHAVTPTKVSGAALEEGESDRAVAVVLLYGAVTGLSWLPFLAYGLEPLNSLFDVVSALGTVGLSAGVTGPGLPSPLKLVLCLDMLMGRVEIVALLILFYRPSWISPRNSA